VVWHILITKFDVRLIIELEDVLLENWFKGWIQSFTNVFKQNGVAKLDGSLGNVQELGVAEFDHAQIVVLLFLFDPFVTLGLRIDNQRPS